MVPVRSRRALLASLGAVALAGCLDRPATTGSATATGEAGPEPPESIESDWPMPAADAGRSSYAPAAAGPTEPVEKLWRAPVETTLSAPVVADGTLYVGGADGTVRALAGTDGSERWRQSVGSPADAPHVVGETVYVPTDGAVVALDADGGAERWRVESSSRGDTLVADHGVYWVADATVVALDRSDGGERWRADVRDPWEPHLFASPDSVFVSTGVHGQRPWTLAADSGTVQGREPESGHDFAAELFYHDGVRYGLDPFFETVQAIPLDGTPGWSQGVPAQEAAAIAGGGDRVYFVGTGAKEPGLYALADADGSVQWDTDAVTSFRGRPVVADGCVLVRADDGLHCFDPDDGSERWTLAADAVGTDLAVADDLVFATGADAVQAFRPPQ
jgi:outer membrane protein assembly factor BamB